MLALLLLAAGVTGFYLLREQPMILRVCPCSRVWVRVSPWRGLPSRGGAFSTSLRKRWWRRKKVVWPSRKETMQTTGIVFAFVLVMAIVLWTTDKGLEWVLYDLILGWKKS